MIVVIGEAGGAQEDYCYNDDYCSRGRKNGTRQEKTKKKKAERQKKFAVEEATRCSPDEQKC
jgi:hypothetical protein